MADEERRLLAIEPDKLPERSDSAPVNFIQTRLPEVHESYNGIRPVFNKVTDRFAAQDFKATVQLPDSSEMIKARDSFVAVFKRYEATEKTGTDIWKQFSWDAVLPEVNNALKKYQGRETEGVRKCLYRCQEQQESVRQWLHLLPAQSWQGSLLCGGVKILCNVRSTSKSMWLWLISPGRCSTW